MLSENEHLGLILRKFLTGKSIFTPIRSVLNLVFLISISSYLFEWYSGEYQWLDLNDFKGVLNFFIKGFFIVPMSCYLIVYFTTKFISSNVIPALVLKVSMQLNDFISGISLKLEDLELDDLAKDNFLLGENFKKHIATPNWVIDYYVLITKSISKNITLEKLQTDFDREKIETQMTIDLLFRSIIAIIIYFIEIPTLGIGLFVVLLLINVVSLFLFVGLNLFYDLLPKVLGKLRYEMNKLIKLRKVESNDLQKG